MHTPTPGTSAHAHALPGLTSAAPASPVTPRAALAAILAEVTPGSRPDATDSCLPAHLVALARQALEAPDPVTLARAVVAHFEFGTLVLTCNDDVTEAEVRDACSTFDAFMASIHGEVQP